MGALHCYATDTDPIATSSPSENTFFLPEDLVKEKLPKVMAREYQSQVNTKITSLQPNLTALVQRYHRSQVVSSGALTRMNIFFSSSDLTTDRPEANLVILYGRSVSGQASEFR